MYCRYFTLFFSLVLSIFPFLEHKEVSGLTYKVNSPEICILKKDLTEISGLSFDADRDGLYAINDEKGIIFSINQKNCESDVLTNFKENGDYEGVEKVGKHIYVLESNGNLLKYNTEKEEITKKYKTNLDIHNDSEGLGFDSKTNSLLIACKGDNSIHKKDLDKDAHSIYRFDLDTKKLVEKPWVVIRAADLLKFYESSLTYFKWLRSKIAEDRFYSFAPSAVAINPIDDKLYVLSTKGKMLVVMTRDQKVDNIYYLEDGTYLQPEGITFDPQGNMYISNEGKSQRGNVLKISSKRR